MLLGLLMVASALSLAVYNIVQSNNAGKASENLMPRIKQAAKDNSGDDSRNTDKGSIYWIDGYDYIGYLTIPTLDLELPVMSRWDYTRLTYAPCRYYGSVKTGDLVIAAHNYSSHFGSLSQLEIGDLVYFTDMDGIVYKHAVGDVETLSPDATEKMIHSNWDLSLYTCNYSGNNRITVRCKLITND